MSFGLAGMILGVIIFGLIFSRVTVNNPELVIVVIPFTIFIDGILLLFILQIIKPVQELTKTAMQIADGNLSKRIQSNSKDEIGQLAQAFNAMADKLQIAQLGLEDAVKAKTLELAQKVEELEAQRAKDDAIFESIGEALVATDNTGYVLLMNSNAQKLMNIDPVAYKEKDLMDLIAVYDEEANHISKENSPVSVALQKGEKIMGKFILVKKNDEKVLINMTSTPVILHDHLNHKTATIGSITIIRDITKEQEVDRMKTEFISLASHQLRTPLAAIKWFIEILLGGNVGDLNTEQKELGHSISDSTQRMIELVNALLNISRIESGKIVITPISTDLKELVETTVKEMEIKCNEKKQKLTISIEQDLPKIIIDPQLVRQVYLNLLTNASKYTPSGGEISLSISKKFNEIISQITDNGYGIPKDQQDKIFRKFFRADNVVKVETDGSGLGLYLVKIIIESLKGKVWFESVEKKGTTFWFSLPLLEDIRQATVDR